MSQDEMLKMKENVHAVLAHSYAFYFVAFLIGLVGHFFLPVEIYKKEVMAFSGFVLLALATMLIVWAQRTSGSLHKGPEMRKESFHRGPYRFTRTPTHWGLFLLVFGFGLVINSLFVALLTALSMLFTRLYFIKREEEILINKYGDPYREYKKSVRL